jgi:hypothetical protein
VNIRNHVPITLELTEPNYDEWRSFFGAFIGKFNLDSHLSSPTATQRCDPEWRVRDQCIISWLYNSISKDLIATVRTPKATGFTIWHKIRDHIRDNELHRAVYLEAEYHNLVQGDMDIKQYTGRLKQLADALHDIGQSVCETSQVLNLLCGLSSKYRHAIPAITAKQPPHTFLSARSYLLLEEHYDWEHVKTVVHHALLATGGARSSAPAPTDGGSSSGSGSTTVASRPAAVPQSAPPRSDNRQGRGRGRGRGGHQGGSSTPRRPAAWTPSLNP